MINTKKVQNRRVVKYESLEDLLTEATEFSQLEIHCLGNWSQGQIYEHLARSLNSSIDGFDSSLPAPVRWIMSLFLKRKFLKDKLPAGFKAPGKFIPEATSSEQGLASLQSAIQRQRDEVSRVPHPGFGEIGLEGWNDFHLRHAEMHMSFLMNDESTDSDC